ncbi:MAG: NADH-quinone oxidoreductase subunit M [bacterium]
MLHQAVNTHHLLTWMTFFPLLTGLLILCLPDRRSALIRWAGVVGSLVPVLLAGYIFVAYQDSGTLAYVERYPWIPMFNIEYYMGIDGLSASLLILTALISFIAVVASWGINKQIKGYFALMMLLETGMIGVFCALDFFLFYIFWELMLLPMYFLIGIWGGPRREYAAIKFFLYTLAGSVLMLLAMLAMYFNSAIDGHHSFDLIAMSAHYRQFEEAGRILGFRFPLIVFAALFIGFAIKIPVWPFHTWLPDAHVEAPTAVSVILAGVLLKMGGYGLLRIGYSIFPQAAIYFSVPIGLLGVGSILYGAFCAMAQTDLKKLVAYSSVSHMGYVLLGIASLREASMVGGVMQMFNHGTATAMMFLLVGVIYDRTHHREINGFGGIGAVVPRYMGVMILATFASMGLPGLSGFISEIFVLLGSFRSDIASNAGSVWHFISFQNITIIAAFGVVITAAYLLRMLQKIFLGPLNPKYEALPDLNAREIFTLVPLGIAVLAFGVYPMPLIRLMGASLSKLAGFIMGSQM